MSKQLRYIIIPINVILIIKIVFFTIGRESSAGAERCEYC